MQSIIQISLIFLPLQNQHFQTLSSMNCIHGDPNTAENDDIAKFAVVVYANYGIAECQLIIVKSTLV